MKTVYYDSYQDDFVTSRAQDYKLPDSYVYIHSNLFYNIFSYILYYLIVIIAVLWNVFFGHISVKNKKCLEKYRRSSYMIYANHTQPFLDVFMPSVAFRWKRLYVLVGTANYGIPIIGKILPALGALPVSGKISGVKKLKSAVHQRVSEGKGIVIYPEAHVWPYYTGIRPFPVSSFEFAVWEDIPVYCMTTTYKKRRFRKKPRMTVWIDGPFFSEKCTDREKRKDLHDQVYSCMLRRSQESNCEYIRYEQRQANN